MPKCLRDISALVPNCPDTSAPVGWCRNVLGLKCLDTDGSQRETATSGLCTILLHSTRVVKGSLKMRTSIYKFEFSFEVFAIRFVTAVYVIVCQSGQWSRQQCRWLAETWLHNYLTVMTTVGVEDVGVRVRVSLFSLLLMGVKHTMSALLQPSFTLKQMRSKLKVACYGHGHAVFTEVRKSVD